MRSMWASKTELPFPEISALEVNTTPSGPAGGGKREAIFATEALQKISATLLNRKSEIH